MAIFTGSGVAIATPFKADLSVDYDAFDRLIEYQIENGTDAIIVCGTTGESATLSEEEHSAVIKHCIERVNHRVPVIAGTGSNATDTAVMLSREAEKDGADALLLVTPYYNKATQNGLYEHYKKVAASVKLPIILYNVPSRTGTNIQPDTVARLCKEIDNIVAIKDAVGDLSQTAKMMALCDGHIDLYSGNDDQILPIMSLGGKGVISVLANVAPKQAHDICQAFMDGDTARAAKLQLDAIPLCNALFCEVNPIPVKMGISYLGFGDCHMRLPLTNLEEAHCTQLKQAMKDYGLPV